MLLLFLLFPVRSALFFFPFFISGPALLFESNSFLSSLFPVPLQPVTYHLCSLFLLRSPSHHRSHSSISSPFLFLIFYNLINLSFVLQSSDRREGSSWLGRRQWRAQSGSVIHGITNWKHGLGVNMPARWRRAVALEWWARSTPERGGLGLIDPSRERAWIDGGDVWVCGHREQGTTPKRENVVSWGIAVGWGDEGEYDCRIGCDDGDGVDGLMMRWQSWDDGAESVG